MEGVTVQARTGTETQAFGMKQGVTDSSGHYFIDDVDPGSYQVTARKGEYQMKTQSLMVGPKARRRTSRSRGGPASASRPTTG